MSETAPLFVLPARPEIVALARTIAVLATAFVLGTAIGFERQWRQRTAGLRTNVLVAVGAAAFADLGLRLRGVEGGHADYRLRSQRHRFPGRWRHLEGRHQHPRPEHRRNTFWCSAAVGTFAGSALLAEAALLTCAVIGANTWLRPLVNWVNRRPIAAGETEAQYRVHAIARPEAVSDVRDLLELELGRANYPVRGVETLSDTEDQVELAAVLLPTTADPAELDAIVASLERSPLIRSATWTVATTA